MPEEVQKTQSSDSGTRKYVLYALIVLSVGFLFYQVFPSVTGKAILPTGGNSKIDINKITAQVLPEGGYTSDAVWGDVINKMVAAGVLDVNKLNDLLTQRYKQPLTEEQKKLLMSDYSNEKISINANDAVLKMYLLWVLAKDNDNPIIHNSPFAKSFKNYNIGVGKAGYGDVELIKLTPEQQAVAEYAAKNSYRPCCGQPTSAPDCSHGYSLLGLIYLMASQGFSKEEIFEAGKYFNSFWFPSNYIQVATYFKITENKDWDDVDNELIMSNKYSSISGSQAVLSYLKSIGV